MNSATLPPWLSPWSSGLVYGQRVYKPGGAGGGAGAGEAALAVSRDRTRHRPRLTIYTYGHDNNAPILRFSSWSEGGGGGSSEGVGAAGGAGAGAVSAAPPPLRAPVRWERVPLDRSPWHIDVPVPLSPPMLDPPSRYDESPSGFDSSAEGLAAWGGVVRGWAAGATLLALLVVVARLAERFLDWKYMLRRRRMHREWQRASVRATCRTEEGFSLAEGPLAGADLPPPYSASGAGGEDGAGGPGTAGGLPKDVEPPPPYSDACVQFINKNGIPVFVYRGEGDRRGDSAEAGHVRRILQACGIELAARAPGDVPLDEDVLQYVSATGAVQHGGPHEAGPPPAYECAPPAPRAHDPPQHLNCEGEVAPDAVSDLAAAADDVAPDSNTAPKDGAVQV